MHTANVSKNSNFQNSQDIHDLYLEDYEDAMKVLSVCPKALGALVEDYYKVLFRDKFGIQKRSLAEEIQIFIELDGIPTPITDAVIAVRIIGNLAAHPSKNENTGEIVSVENGEAEWLIEVREALFGFVFFNQ